MRVVFARIKMRMMRFYFQRYRSQSRKASKYFKHE